MSPRLATFARPQAVSSLRRGMTLIEVMVVVAIIAIIASIALPAYERQSVRVRRAAAVACLVQQAQHMERVYASNMRYDTDGGAATTVPALPCSSEISATYTFGFATGSLGNRSYTLQAVPQGNQATADARCGTLSLTQDGTRGRSGTGETAANCWR